MRASEQLKIGDKPSACSEVSGPMPGCLEGFRIGGCWLLADAAHRALASTPRSVLKAAKDANKAKAAKVANMAKEDKEDE